MSAGEISESQEKELRHKLSLYQQMVEIYPSESKYLRRMIELQLLLGEEQDALERMRKLEKLYQQEGNGEEAEALKQLRLDIASHSKHDSSVFHPFLSDLSSDALEMLMNDSKRIHLQEGDTLIRQGDTDNRLFIVLEGELAVLVQYRKDNTPTLIHTLGEGSIVGEMAFLEGSSRSATVVAHHESTVLELSHKRVLKCLLQFPEVATALRHESLQRKRFTAINSNHFFAKLDGHAKDTLAGRSEIATYKPFEVIAMANEKLPWVGIVIAGLIRGVAEDREGNSHLLTPIKPGDTIGDLEALNNSRAMCDMVAVNQTDILQVPVIDFLTVMEHNPTIKNRILEYASERISSTMVMLTGKVETD